MLFKVLRKLAQRAGKWLSGFAGRAVLEGLIYVSKSFDKALNNVNFNMTGNGELRVLKILAEDNPRCIFDVGANAGEYTRMALEFCPGCVIHSFEIVPDTFNKLVNNVKSDGVRFVNKGLSDKAGLINIYVSNREDTTATACKIDGMRGHDDYYAGAKVYECEVTTGFEYLTANNIEQIDLLKVDVEGMDYRALSGFGDSLGKVKCIQFEYGVFNIASKDLLVDFYRLLVKHGFVIGKIMPKGVIFNEYHFSMEDFYGNNYLAVKKNDQALISRLKL